MATIAAGADEGIPAAAATGGAAPAKRRIEALDFVRGVALCGILLMNITGFGLPDAYSNPMNSGGATGVNLWAWIITQVGFEGTQRALFSMLFGASVILLTSRLEQEGRGDAADIYFRRNLWLIAFGMVNAFLFLWWGDILYAYGVTALFVYTFRNMAPKWLLIVGIGALLLGAVWNAYDTRQVIAKHDAWLPAAAAQAAGRPLTDEQKAAISAWEEARGEFKSTPAEIAEAVQARTNGYWPMFRRTATINSWFQSWFMYRYFFDIFGMMLIGMALFHLGVLTIERPARLYWAMLIGGYGVGIAVNVAETRWVMDHGFSAIAFAQSNISYDLGRLAMTIGHLGGLLLFVRSGALAWLRRALAAVGQMAVTNYLTHSVVCGFLFIGLGWYNQLERHQLYYVVFAIWAAQLIVSPLWLKHYRFGPVEWLWRTLTYMKRQPMRRAAAAA
ncbi:MAG TPA: DUF418 domain-containing protein [Allosphingosinicella sp.]|nr:DUF418 domain-containing protein [Allosphingosinicella sp.]